MFVELTFNWFVNIKNDSKWMLVYYIITMYYLSRALQEESKVSNKRVRNIIDVYSKDKYYSLCGT